MKRLMLAAVFTFCLSTSAFAIQRYTYCIVNTRSMSEAWVSGTYRQDFGTGYTGDPQVYGGLVNRFTAAVQEQFSVDPKTLAAAVCYQPTGDDSHDTVDAQRASTVGNYSKVHRVVWP
jgi:hypothetical protein